MPNYKNYIYRDLYKWNPVYNFLMDIKDRAIELNVNLNDESIPFKNIINQVGTDLQVKMASILQFNRKRNLVLVRYGSYSDILSGESDITMDEMWDMYDGFYRECRSIVVDIQEENIVLCPFAKFRNLNEGEENSLERIQRKIRNCSSFEVSNKLDGSMQSATWHNNKVVMAGSQAVDMDDSWRLQDGYSMLMSNENYINALKNYPGWTLIFEYISLKDAHVVKYTKEQEGLYLIGMRNNTNGVIASYKKVLDVANAFNLKTTSVFNKGINDVLNDIKKYKSDEMEGFVLNIDGYLVKVKCDDYVEIHKTISSLSSTNGIIKAIGDEAFDDFISKIPEAYKERVVGVSVKVFDYIRLIDTYVKQETRKCKDMFDNRKDFMIYVNKEYPSIVKSYIINEYLGRKNNYIKSGNDKHPHYKKIAEIEHISDWLRDNTIEYNNEMKPCPICHAPAGIAYVSFKDGDVWFRPECTECECGWKFNYPTRKEAVEAWNKREEYKGLSKFNEV